jgi:hypothetical protein
MATGVFNLIRRRRPVRPLLLNAKSRQLEIDVRRSAVMIVDMQNDFISKGGWFDARNVDANWVKPLYPGHQRDHHVGTPARRLGDVAKLGRAG